jgi:hypothetical protein
MTEVARGGPRGRHLEVPASETVEGKGVPPIVDFTGGACEFRKPAAPCGPSVVPNHIPRKLSQL